MPFYAGDFIFCQPIQLIDQLVDLQVGGVNLTLNHGLFFAGLGFRQLLVN